MKQSEAWQKMAIGILVFYPFFLPVSASAQPSLGGNSALEMSVAKRAKWNHPQPEEEKSSKNQNLNRVTRDFSTQTPNLNLGSLDVLCLNLVEAIFLYFDEDERCAVICPVSKEFKKAVTRTFQHRYPVGELIKSVPLSLRDRLSTVQIVHHALNPHRALAEIEKYFDMGDSIEPFLIQPLTLMADLKKRDELVKKLKNLALQVDAESTPQIFILNSIRLMQGEINLDADSFKSLIQVFENQLLLTHSPILCDLLAAMEMRGIGSGAVNEIDPKENKHLLQLDQILQQRPSLSPSALRLLRTHELKKYLRLIEKLSPLIDAGVEKDPFLGKKLSEEVLNDFRQFRDSEFLSLEGAWAAAIYLDKYEKDIESTPFYQFAVLKGHKHALVSLGYAYEGGLGVPQSYQRAYDYYQMAKDYGIADGFWNIGILIQDGRISGNDETGLNYFVQAAELCKKESQEVDSQLALMRVADYHLFKNIPSPDYDLARSYLLEGEKNGYPDAFLVLAKCHHFGKTFVKDDQMALSYLEKTIEKGEEWQKEIAQKYQAEWFGETKTETKIEAHAIPLSLEITFPSQ